MAEEHAEPGELTERFRAFAERVDPPAGKALPMGLIVAGIAIAVVLVAVVWFLIAS
jgi:hypothetical protein